MRTARRLVTSLAACQAFGLLLPNVLVGQTTILTAGMRLIYESGGKESPPWVVDSVATDVSVGGKSGCRRVYFAPGGPRSSADVRTTCTVGGLYWAWDSTTAQWKAARPIGSNAQLEVPSANRAVARYVTSVDTTVVISGYPLTVVRTTVTTRDSAGREIRRLREFFSEALGTATWGVFEVPDTASGSRWRVQQEFTLRKIDPPRPTTRPIPGLRLPRPPM